MVYTSRYANPLLKNGKFTAVRISLGFPKWELGYSVLDFKELMPFGLLNKYEDYESFKVEYFKKLDKIGVRRIQEKLNSFSALGKDVVLLCYEDIRKGPEDWCHRTAFAEWWLINTGEKIDELFDPTKPKIKENKPKKIVSEEGKMFQLTFF